MSFRIIAAFVIFLFGMRVNAQTVMPSEPLSKALTIFELPPFERAICCIKYYEGLHRKKIILTLDMDIDCYPEKGIHPR